MPYKKKPVKKPAAKVPAKRGPGRPKKERKVNPVIERAKKKVAEKNKPDDKPKTSGKPFEVGNQFWLLRTKHGRDKLFSKPEILWEASMEYFQWCVDNPLIEVDFKGKDATEVKIPKMRPFTWQGLELYLDISSLKDYKNNDKYKDFNHVIARIEKIMYKQKFEGAASGFLNPNIIARDLGLRESTHISVDDERKSTGELFPDMNEGED